MQIEGLECCSKRGDEYVNNIRVFHVWGMMKDLRHVCGFKHV